MIVKDALAGKRLEFCKAEAHTLGRDAGPRWTIRKAILNYSRSGRESQSMITAKHEGDLNRELEGRIGARRVERPESFWRTAFWVLVSGACYYLATQIAWALCFPNSKVSLLFPPHAVLVSILLAVPTRHWWAYTLAAICGHLLAAQQAQWPLLYSLHCEVFDAVQNVSVAAGIRIFIKSRLESITLRDAIAFVLIAVIVVPFGTAFWGAAFTLSNHYGTHYWIEWRNLGISNAVTAIVLVPAILLGVHQLAARRIKAIPGRLLEGGLLGAGIVMVGVFAFYKLPAGPDASPALLYAPIPLLIWAALRFGLGGISASMLVITFQAIWGTMHGRGPFLMQTPAENALALQMFLLVTATPLMFLAVTIAEEKRSRDSLRESEERYREVVESQTDLVCRFLPDTTLTFVNEAYCRFFGRSRDELIGHKFLDLLPETAQGAALNHVRSLVDNPRTETYEHEVVLPDARIRWQQWTDHAIVGSDGRVTEFQAIGRDVTDRKRAEEARRNLAHATRMSTMGTMAGSLAHELNQPLTAILSNAQAGSRFLAGPSPNVSEVRDLLHDIAQDTKRAGEVIRQLRTLVKKDQPKFEKLDLNGMIQDMVRLLHSDTVIRKVRIALDLDSGLRSVRGDSVQVQQVILNLMLNAFDAMKEVPEGERKVSVRTRQPDGSIQIEVSDCGTGIHPEQLTRVFEPFQTTKPDGLGLGLSISRSIVEAHGGRLWVENNPDRGATFYLTLPTAEVRPVISKQ
jgi:PAS domain S-box-containing protein